MQIYIEANKVQSQRSQVKSGLLHFGTYLHSPCVVNVFLQLHAIPGFNIHRYKALRVF
jgi:hypothetical protein